MPRDELTKDFQGDSAEDRKARALIKNERKAAAFDYAIAKARQFPQQADEIASLKASVAAMERSLNRPIEVKAALAPPAQPKPAVRRPRIGQTVALAIAAELVRRLDNTRPSDFIKQVLPRDEDRLARRLAERFHKAATQPGHTTTPGWGEELVPHAMSELYQDLAPTSAMARLVDAGFARRLDFRGAGSLTVPRRTRGTLGGHWVQEGSTIPVKGGEFQATTANRFKMAVISTLSEEIKRVSRPEIVGLIETALREDTAMSLDAFFLDDQSAVPGVRPGGILVGASDQASAGTTIDDVAADLRWLLGKLIAVRARRPVLLINPLLIASLGLKYAPGTGVSPFVADIAKGQLAGIPYIAADSVPVDQVIALDGDSLMIGLDLPEFDTTSEASVVILDSNGTAPAMGTADGNVDETTSVHLSDAAGTVPPAQVRSMWQTWSVAARYIQPASWHFVRSDAVFRLTGVAW